MTDLTPTEAQLIQAREDYSRAVDGLNVWLDWMEGAVGKSVCSIPVGDEGHVIPLKRGRLLSSVVHDYLTGQRIEGAHLVVDRRGNFLLVPADLDPYVDSPSLPICGPEQPLHRLP